MTAEAGPRLGLYQEANGYTNHKIQILNDAIHFIRRHTLYTTLHHGPEINFAGLLVGSKRPCQRIASGLTPEPYIQHARLRRNH